MQILDQSTSRDFVWRFGQVGDALLRTFNYAPVEKTATVAIEIQDLDCDDRWVIGAAAVGWSAEAI